MQNTVLRSAARSDAISAKFEAERKEGEWYRYHHLFSDLLLCELKRSHPELVPDLHERASAWLEDEGYFHSAIRHAIAAGDYERVAMLISRYWYEYVATGHFATVERWLESLPESLVTQDAALVLC